MLKVGYRPSVDKHFPCPVAFALDIDSGHELAGDDAHSVKVEIIRRTVAVDEIGRYFLHACHNIVLKIDMYRR